MSFFLLLPLGRLVIGRYPDEIVWRVPSYGYPIVVAFCGAASENCVRWDEILYLALVFEVEYYETLISLYLLNVASMLYLLHSNPTMWNVFVQILQWSFCCAFMVSCSLAILLAAQEMSVPHHPLVGNDSLTKGSTSSHPSSPFSTTSLTVSSHTGRTLIQRWTCSFPEHVWTTMRHVMGCQRIDIGIQTSNSVYVLKLELTSAFLS